MATVATQPRPIPPGKVRDRILQEVNGADKLLRKVTDPADPDFSRDGGPAVEPRDIVQAPGLAFHLLKKAGVGIGVLQGRGFVMQKNTTPEGGVSWSAPLFFKVTGMSLGAIVGWEKIETLLLPSSYTGVRKYLDPKSTYGIDYGFGAGHAVAAPQVPDKAPMPGGEPRIFSYTDHAGIIDISLKGASIHRDDYTMEEVYGPLVRPQDVLDGRVPPPVEFKPVYDDLRSLVDAYNREVAAKQQAGVTTTDNTPVIFLTYDEYLAVVTGQPTATDAPIITPLDTSLPDPLLNIDLDDPVGVDPALLATPDVLPTMLPTALPLPGAGVGAGAGIPVA